MNLYTPRMIATWRCDDLRGKGESILPSVQNDPEVIREEAVNTLLARMLRGYGASARAERRSRMGAPDVRVELKTGDSVLLECKWDGSRRLLEDQLDERLDAFPEPIGLIGGPLP